MRHIAILILVLMIPAACSCPSAPTEKKQTAEAPKAQTEKAAVPVMDLKPAAKKTLVWGMPTKGLSANVSMVKSDYKVGEPIPIIYTKMNITMDQDIDVWDAGFWPNHKLFVRDANGNDVDMTPRGEEISKAFSPGGSRDKSVKVTIGPRMSRSPLERYNIAEYFKLDTPGTYTVQVVYEEYNGGWEGRLWSNPYKFTITK